MNTQPEKNEKKTAQPHSTLMKKTLVSLPGRLWRILRHNWGWKLLSLFLALCLWAGLITQDPTLTRERTFTDVAVSVTGADTLRRNGLIVLNDFSTSPLTVRLRADVPQREYNTVSATNYNPRVDLSKITQTGTQTLRISTTSTTTYGSVKELSPDTVEVEVDEYITRYRIPVTVNRIGSYPSGFYGTTPSLDPATVVISGPKSMVSQIARVTVNLDVSTLPAKAGLIRTSAPIELTDLSGNTMESQLLQVTSESVLLRSITVEQQLYPTRSLALSNLNLVTGTPKEGYEIKSVTATPSAILAAGDENALSLLDTLFVDQALDVTGMDQTFVGEVRIRKPSELVYTSTDTVRLTVEIGPKMSTRTFTGVKLTLRDVPEGLQASSEQATVSVTLTGPAMKLGQLKNTQIVPFVDLTGLEAGNYGLPVSLALDETAGENSFTYAIDPDTVSVTLK